MDYGTKILLLVCAATLSIAPFAAGQENARYELFAGGSYLRVHSSGAEVSSLTGMAAIDIQAHNQNFNLMGWSTSITENVNSWFGGEFAFGGFYGSPGANFLYPASQLVSSTPNFSQQVPVVTRFQTYMFGPRFSYRRHSHFVPYAHLLIGAGNATASLNESAVVASDFSVLPAGKLKSSTALAVSPGLGIDLPLSERVTLRPLQVDYLMTRFFGARQDNAQVSAGVVIKFGER